ncbi:MAG: hypothetical protein IKG40_02020 [Bacilli bacterium]|nr:hypothetical protein [Bacilli bacterium]
MMDELELMNKNKQLMCLTVEFNLNKIKIYAEEGSYDCRNCDKLLKRFEAINKNSYGALYDFECYVSDSRKYYNSKKCEQLATEVIVSVDRFINNFKELLI